MTTQKAYSVCEELLSDKDYLNSGELESMHTRQLLEIKNVLHRYSDGYHDTKCEVLDKLNRILSTREHIPNKAEAKKIRQEKAKQHR